MNPQTIVKKWVAALRSGKYTQTNDFLKANTFSDNVGYCCLGVLCDVLKKDLNGEWMRNKDTIGGWDFVAPSLKLSTTLNTTIRNLIPNFDENFENKLIYANDGGTSFEEIANMIEAKFS